MKNVIMSSNKSVIHTLRSVASFALLGAVTVGAVSSSFDLASVNFLSSVNFDLRTVGAVVGASVPLFAKIFHLL